MKERLYIISQLADDLDITGQGLHKILDGRSQKPNRRTLERLAELTETRLGFDQYGVYFEPFDKDEKENKEQNSQVVTERNELLKILSEYDNEKLRTFINLIWHLDKDAQQLVFDLIHQLSRQKTE